MEINLSIITDQDFFAKILKIYNQYVIWGPCKNMFNTLCRIHRIKLDFSSLHTQLILINLIHMISISMPQYDDK